MRTVNLTTFECQVIQQWIQDRVRSFDQELIATQRMSPTGLLKTEGDQAYARTMLKKLMEKVS